MLLDLLKTTVQGLIPSGSLIRRANHVSANDKMIEELYYPSWGIPQPFLGNTVPEGYKLWNTLSQTVLISECNPKFVAIMTPLISIYGGNGTTTLGIPYIKPGTSLVQSGTGTDYTFSLGVSGGEEKHLLTTGEIPSHSHSQTIYDSDSAGGTRPAISPAGGGGTLLSGLAATGLTGGGLKHNNMPPYFPINYILRYQ